MELPSIAIRRVSCSLMMTALRSTLHLGAMAQHVLQQYSISALLMAVHEQCFISGIRAVSANARSQSARAMSSRPSPVQTRPAPVWPLLTKPALQVQVVRLPSPNIISTTHTRAEKRCNTP
jgi:hypothetical protein